MKILVLALLCVFTFMFVFWEGGYTQDNIFGDFLMTDLEKKVSLDLEGANLLDVLKMLSQQTGLNFISTEAVKGRTLTLYMEEVPLKEAMDLIFKANNLAYDYYPESNIFIIKEMGKPSQEIKTKVYQLRYTRLASSKMQSEVNELLGKTSQEKDKSGIRAAIEGVLTKAGKVTEEPITNSLIVSDVPSQFPAIDSVIAKLDVPAPKVMIEVEMLDVSKTRVDKLGFNFSNGLYAKYTGGSKTTTFPFPHRMANATESVLTLGTLDLTSFDVIMQFLRQDTTTKFLARPKILTLSNETAEVNLTVDEAIGLTTVVSSVSDTTSNDIERKETGTKLRVTPQVNLENREVTLMVQMFNRESTDSGLQLSTLSGDIKNVEERGTKSVVRLQDGETLFIGGLIREETSETRKKVPILGDIPVIGALFRYKERLGPDNQERELLLFITPHIIDDRPSFAREGRLVDREQAFNSSKEKAVRVALDSFIR